MVNLTFHLLLPIKGNCDDNFPFELNQIKTDHDGNENQQRPGIN